METRQEVILPAALTFLSPYVHRLILEKTRCSRIDEQALNTEGLLSIDYVAGKLPEERDDSDSYFEACVTALAPMFCAIEDYLEERKHDLPELFGRYLLWTGQDQLLLELWDLLKSEDVIDELTVLLVTTAVLERSLGDLYIMRGPEPCPSMLKDLLMSPHLQDILGSALIQILRVMIGPPTSLNIRNVTWHGFPYPGEIPRRCIWFMVLLVPSIGQVLEEQIITSIHHRQPVTFPEVKLISDVNFMSTGEDEWLKVVSQTSFVPWNSRDFWLRMQEFQKQKKYGYCAALLLYYLEQGLRLVFATVNQCEDRILTAEATKLYTTFDEILDSQLPDGSENKLKHGVSDRVVEILLDHLVYPAGPRVRDRLSHGEASWELFPWQLSHNLAVIAVVLSIEFVSPKCHVNGPCLKILQGMEEYKLQFHRIPLLKRSISQCCQKTVEIDRCVQVQPGLTSRTEKENLAEPSVHPEICDSLQQVWAKLSAYSSQFEMSSVSYSQRHMFLEWLHDLQCDETNFNGVLCESEKSETQTWDPESEILSLMEHVIAEGETVLSNLEQFALLRQKQLAEKQLRSRQRENYRKFLNSFPSYVVVTGMCCCICGLQTFRLSDIKQQDESLNRSRLRFWRTCLQFCENLRTCSQLDKNKWSEGLDLIQQFTNTLPDRLSKNLFRVNENGLQQSR